MAAFLIGVYCGLVQDGAMGQSLKVYAGLTALILLTCLAYYPGLSGGFLFDDFVNLDALGATGPVDNWATFFRYVTSGTADPTGRPLAMLSFLIDARDWPADPTPFLRTNLAIHVFNGVLLFALVRSLGLALGDKSERAAYVAVLASGFWMLHPLFVSTTLYIVQREAMLPATMTLAGLLCYVYGRKRFATGDSRAGASFMVAGIIGGTFLAALCKGNGVLLPLLAWVLESTLFRRTVVGPQPAPPPPLLHVPLLVAPTLFVVAYLVSFLPDLGLVAAGREWTGWQRLLTQPRVLIDYLWLLAVPRSISTGLYNDGYVASQSLLAPLSTLPALVTVVLAPVLAWRARAKFPALSAAVLFYLGAQLLESTTIQLELYFEHRNYLPALLLFWPLARSIVNAPTSSWVRMSFAAFIVALLTLTTHQRATLWGQPQLMAELWARESPESSRAQVTAAMMQASAGRPDLAVARLGPLWTQNPSDLQLALNFINASCKRGGLSARDLNALRYSLATATSRLPLVHSWLGNAIDVAAEGRCAGLTLADVESFIDAYASNPLVLGDLAGAQEVKPLYARLALHRGLAAQALMHFNEAFLAAPSPNLAARQVAFLARGGAYSEALSHLELYEANKRQLREPAAGMAWIHEQVLVKQNYWEREMDTLRNKLEDELSK